MVLFYPSTLPSFDELVEDIRKIQFKKTADFNKKGGEKDA
jgi:hypothetical protein